MAKSLYRNIWAPEQVRTIVLGVFVATISFLIEVIFLFFPADIKNTIFSFLFFEIELFGGNFTPLLTILHLIVWGVMFFAIIIVYAIIREYAGGIMNLLEIGAVYAVFFISTLLLFDAWFSVFFTAIAAGIVVYFYLALGNE